VLPLIADGRSIAGIAAQLHVSATTVKTHLRKSHEKLGVSTRAAAVAEAIRRGVVR
jgi:two-component system nitrate/nitrite response regulator NarL